ncbi:RagB/SusD family nutrient uptake outer membrane protein [Phocaeicola coprocola]
MKKNSIKLLIIGTAFASVLSGCGDGWFERDPKNILTNEQVWNDPNMVKSQLANLYNRITHLHGDFNTGGMTEIDDAMWCGALDGNGRNNFQYGNDYGRLWDYGLMRDINMSIENLETYGTELTEEEKSLFKAEFRFIRAYIYFDMVRRMGGVPLITSTLEYDYSGDPSYLQHPRAKEHEVYDFVYSECEAVKNDLKANAGSQTRANYFTALALESRAMLYAASIAKYNALYTPTLVTDGGEVGIPASMADDYYRKSLAASKEIIKDGGYDLYNKNADKVVNFYKLFMDKEKNPEIIWAKDYKNPVKVHSFGFDNVIQHLKEDNENSSCIGPSLGLVEAFDYLDGTPGKLKYMDENNNYKVFDNPADLFANKDARLYGTVIYPGTKYRGSDVDIQAGVAVWNDEKQDYDLLSDPTLGSTYTDGKTYVGQDGPLDGAQNVSNTGFYIRKYISEEVGFTLRNYEENWWPWFRLGEIYLNAAEASFELGDEDPGALFYINKLRERAGFPANSLTSLTLEKIQNERRVEMAFEDQRYFDLKRWRIADDVWDGDESENSTAVVYGLYPYRIAKAKPGTNDTDKYIFVKHRSSRFILARMFRMSNYYSSIADDVINNNPLIVKNPLQ